MIDTIEFTLNNKPVRASLDTDRTFLWVLRTDLGLTGTKYGCGMGQCGACTVIVDREAVRSCQISVSEITGKNVLTIEGLALNGNLHPLQKAFMDHDALQCGYCTSGMILNAYSFLLKNSAPRESQIIEAMEDNLCRCGVHQRIVSAIQDAAKQMGEAKS
jgi:aerobic-type carbon monoxide dehydrogenase small subunit (CoxS/CutS family)